MIKSLMAYLIYPGILHIDLPPAEKKISYKKFFFPAIQMSSLLETAGQR